MIYLSAVFSLMEVHVHRKTVTSTINKTALVIGILLMFAVLQCKQRTTVPPELIGTWTTNEPKYEGCLIEISKEEIHIGTRDGSVDIGTIENFRESAAGLLTLYTIDYTSTESHKTIDF